ncbi:MAG TPA: type II toxin-antitoxin system VapC family toxin [Novosphingobium sp.]|nr:type II toxin-antitoxin system VapC family toxin [Novosphingobium sp.]
MRLLLDTHILLWRLAGSDRLPSNAIDLMDEDADELLASAASIWEVSIKWSLRKGAADDMPLSGKDFAAALDEAGIAVLPITPAHAAALDDLEMHHRDPFDRLLIATARHEGLTLLTHDVRLADYGKVVRLV